jgi:ureidoacrylate peracid hydrolase
MHGVTLSDGFLAALSRRQAGRAPLLESADASGIALLVIDMQNVFVDAASPLAVPTAAGIVPNINRLAGTLRDRGGSVFWVRTRFEPSGRSSWPLYFEHIAPAGAGELRALFRPGDAMFDFWPALARDRADVVVEKDRFSAFVEGASDLHARLEAASVDSLVITGTLTNVCCESTMRDAMMLGYRCTLVDDATAAQSDREHLAALENAALYFGDVLPTETVIGCLGNPGRAD